MRYGTTAVPPQQYLLCRCPLLPAGHLCVSGGFSVRRERHSCRAGAGAGCANPGHLSGAARQPLLPCADRAACCLPPVRSARRLRGSVHQPAPSWRMQAWLRVALGYHTVAQVIAGWLVGGGSAALWHGWGHRTVLPHVQQHASLQVCRWAAGCVHVAACPSISPLARQSSMPQPPDPGNHTGPACSLAATRPCVPMTCRGSCMRPQQWQSPSSFFRMCGGGFERRGNSGGSTWRAAVTATAATGLDATLPMHLCRAPNPHSPLRRSQCMHEMAERAVVSAARRDHCGGCKLTFFVSNVSVASLSTFMEGSRSPCVATGVSFSLCSAPTKQTRKLLLFSFLARMSARSA